MEEEKDKTKYYDDPMGRLAVKNAMAWYGWGSPVGLGLLLIAVGAFLWLMHLANIIH